jgi:excisionase family DNA binding protein
VQSDLERPKIPIREAVKMTGLDKGTIRRYAITGLIRGYRIAGHTIRVDKQDVADLIQPIKTEPV